jgi:hypothetical protein
MLVLRSGELNCNCYFIGSLKEMTGVTTARKSIVSMQS